MNKIPIFISFLLFFVPAHADIMQSIKNETSSLSQKASRSVQAAGEKISDTFNAFSNKANKYFDAIIQNTKNIFGKEAAPIFCATNAAIKYAPTVDDPDVIAADTENIIPTIKKYAPILYLCHERYYPMAAEDYFLAPETQLVYRQGNTKAIVIERGQVTMEKIHENSKKYAGKDYFFEIGQCTHFGSNPAQFTDKLGNLSTPVYVTWQKYNNNYYIVYGFFYGFNGAYPINMPITNLPLVKGDIAGIQGAHECDIEHITLELNEQKQLQRIHFAAHTSGEGTWLPAQHSDIQYEGTHPIVYVAQNGHGSYPRAGTHVRIYGFGNDITCKGKKWVPQLVLLYPEDDPRANPKTMGWAYHSGNYGPRGVDSFKRFFDAKGDLPKGQPYENVQFCPNPQNPNNPADWTKYRACIESKRINAKIPEKKTFTLPIDDEK